MNRILFFSLVVLSLVMFSCKKERSLEASKKSGASGSLQTSNTGECLPKNVQGAYIAGTSLGATNFIEVEVNVDTEGSYDITTDTLNGYYFSASGEFATTGINTIKLMGKGKPLAEGVDVFTVSFDSTVCAVDVAVLPSTAGGPASFTLQPSGSDCITYTLSGDYVKGVALTSSNKVNIDVNVTTIGTYNISTTATNGMTFSGAGMLGATGVQTITLTGSGTPVNSGAISIPVTAGSTSCNFSVTVAATPSQPPPLPTYYWKFTSGGVTYQGSVDSADADLYTESGQGFNFAVFEFYGETITGDTAISLGLADISGAISANETYSSTATSNNAFLFYLEDGGGSYDADPATAGASMTAKVTSINTTTRVVIGTFSGTAKDATTGATKTITNGEFKVNY